LRERDLETQLSPFCRCLLRPSLSVGNNNTLRYTTLRYARYVNPKTGEASPLVSQEVWEIVMKNKELLDNAIDYTKDFEYDYFGFKTLERSYLLKMNGRIVERPQHMLVCVRLMCLYLCLCCCCCC
jgi:hypothetical protein